MKPVIMVDNYYQNVYITLGQAVQSLISAGKKLQVNTLLYKFNRVCDSHSQCMDAISQFVNIVYSKEELDENAY